jgi:hypothetical protein
MIVDIAVLWWEEQKSIVKMNEARELAYKRIIELCRHGHVEFCELELYKLYFDIVERQEIPVRRDAIVLATKARSIVNYTLLDAHVKKDADLMLKTLLSLPSDFRKHYIENISEPEKSWLRELLGDEVLELLKKSRVELKLVLSVDEVLPLVRRYGKEWREEARKLLEKALALHTSGEEE